MAADIRALTAIHRVRVAKKARELSDRAHTLNCAEKAHQDEVAAQQKLYEESDSAVAALAPDSHGLFSSFEIQCASEYSTASRWAAWDKIGSIEKLNVAREEAMTARSAAQVAWRAQDARRQSVESLSEKLAETQYREMTQEQEATEDESFLASFAMRSGSQS